MHSPNSVLPLRMSSDALAKIVKRYEVEAALVPIVLSFAEGLHPVESGATNLSMAKRTDDEYSRT